ncbi:MAG: hypothetical protein IKO61_10600 [Lachnospiraceae bacterium]|nr:hypothetical protein [Lachnospiraceae bacterium]
MIGKQKKPTAFVLIAALVFTLFTGLAPAEGTKAAGSFNVYLGNYDTRIYAGGIYDLEIYTDLPAGTEVTYQWQCGYGYRLEGMQIKLLSRTAAAPGKTDNSYNKKQ